MTQRLHVAFVHDDFPEYRHRLFALLSERHDLEFFFINQPNTALPAGSRSLRGFRIPEMSDYVLAPGLVSCLLRIHRRSPFDLFSAPDLGYFSAEATFLAARLTRRPLVLWSGEWFPARHPRRWLTSPLERSMARGAASCLAYGSRAAARLRVLGARPEAIYLTGNASDYHFSRVASSELDRVRRERHIGDRPVLLFLGRLVPFKAPDVLLRALAILERQSPVFAIIAGGGPMLAGLRRLSAELGLANVHFTGESVRGSNEKDLLYSLADIFVLPSRRWRVAEPWGLVLNEAASARLPIVASEWVGAAGDLVRDGETAYLVPDNDPARLAAAVLTILKDPGRARAVASRACELARSFTVERMAEAFDVAYWKAAQESP